MRNKFNAIKVKTEYGTFDSKKEYAYFKRLMIQKKAVNLYDRVSDIQRQVRYDIAVEGKHICFYKLDFKVKYADGRVEHVDVKGLKKGAAHQIFRIKKKLVEAIFKIEILET